MTADRTHRCPIRRCRYLIPIDRLMCREHWFMVPRALRDEVWYTWRHGLTARHEIAAASAIKAVDERLAEELSGRR